MAARAAAAVDRGHERCHRHPRDRTAKPHRPGTYDRPALQQRLCDICHRLHRPVLPLEDQQDIPGVVDEQALARFTSAPETAAAHQHACRQLDDDYRAELVELVAAAYALVES